MRSDYLFNDNWLYLPREAPPELSDETFQDVTLPHSNRILPHHNFDDAEYQFISTYRKRFTLPKDPGEQRVILRFEGVMSAATVRINNHTFDEHRGGFVPFEYDITDYLHTDADSENLLEVHVDSRERADIPPYGGQVDYLVFGGIYRDAQLLYRHPVHIEHVRVKTHDVLSDAPHLEIDVWLTNQTDAVQSVTVMGGLEYWKTEIQRTEIPAQSHAQVTLHSNLQGMPSGMFKRWSPENPKLYQIAVGVYDDDTALSAHEVQFDGVEVQTGFRQIEFRDDGFYLNGEKRFLRGLNRHQMFPFIGMAAPKRLQERDADIIKKLGCNIVRCSHYPQSRHFLNHCDAIGLLVFEEIPGWQHIGDDAWQELSLRDVRAMIERDWNHPSIVLWGVRINESWDDTDFYTRTNQLARDLDPTRPTTGVRFWPHSEFLEDVYGYNDFSNGVIEPTQTPWLITEFNGHMFPTKTFDNEERQLEHALRHARIQAQAIHTGGVSGAIGWCAFDYNTHLDFGSGDRVCYHGVMDMFRQPKWAAEVYRSQKDPSEEVVLSVASFWTMGDRAGGGNDPLYILTNCDYIEVFVGDEQHGRFEPAHDEFPGLPHPPVKVSGLGLHWGGKFDGLKVIGYLNDEPATEQCISADSIPQTLELRAEHNMLFADGIDMTRIVVRITDRYGNRLPYATQPVHFEIEGDAYLIGENPFALVGGQAALFVRAGRTPGAVVVRARTPRLQPADVTIQLEPASDDII